ncbi:MAG TPA: hypothetical protein VJ400_07925 [Thermoplasmata archaeon]|nr:hypothetical protein [Thermoplasmata archaeon]
MVLHGLAEDVGEVPGYRPEGDDEADEDELKPEALPERGPWPP